MGKVIDATGIFRMRRLECDVERAESGQFHEAFTRMLAKDRALCKSQGDLSGLRTLFPWGNSVLQSKEYQEAQRKLTEIMEHYADTIIFPSTPKED